MPPEAPPAPLPAPASNPGSSLLSGLYIAAFVLHLLAAIVPFVLGVAGLDPLPAGILLVALTTIAAIVAALTSPVPTASRVAGAAIALGYPALLALLPVLSLPEDSPVLSSGVAGVASFALFLSWAAARRLPEAGYTAVVIGFVLWLIMVVPGWLYDLMMHDRLVIALAGVLPLVPMVILAIAFAGSSPRWGTGLPPGAPAPVLRPAGTHSLALSSLITGLIAFFPLAIAFGHVALRDIDRTGQGGRGVALAGLVLGYAGAVAIGVFSYFWFSWAYTY